MVGEAEEFEEGFGGLGECWGEVGVRFVVPFEGGAGLAVEDEERGYVEVEETGEAVVECAEGGVSAACGVLVALVCPRGVIEVYRVLYMSAHWLEGAYLFQLAPGRTRLKHRLQVVVGVL